MFTHKSNKEYYPWSKYSSFHEPWARQYLHTDFLEYEKRRIDLVSNWTNEFKKASIGSDLGTVDVYILPAETNKNFDCSKTVLDKYPDYRLVFLSALPNSAQYPIFGLVEKDKSPQYYSLIRIDKSIKKRLTGKSLYPEDIVLISDFQLLPSDKPLIDVPYEDNFLSKILGEELNIDKKVLDKTE